MCRSSKTGILTTYTGTHGCRGGGIFHLFRCWFHGAAVEGEGYEATAKGRSEMWGHSCVGESRSDRGVTVANATMKLEVLSDQRALAVPARRRCGPVRPMPQGRLMCESSDLVICLGRCASGGLGLCSIPPWSPDAAGRISLFSAGRLVLRGGVFRRVRFGKDMRVSQR